MPDSMTSPDTDSMDCMDINRKKTTVKHLETVPVRCRKIIISTEVAETSVTIPNVQHVVDTGKMKQAHHNSLTEESALHTCWISKSSAEQRAGRSGRTSDGVYWATIWGVRLRIDGRT